MNRILSHVPLGLLCLHLTMIAGCGGKANEPVHPVTGQVLLDGKPLAEAMVVFHRQGTSGRGLTAFADKDGRFKLTSYRQADGAPVGEYLVTVELRDFVQDGDEKTRTGRNLLPPRYASKTSSGFRCEVKAGNNELAPLELKSR